MAITKIAMPLFLFASSDIAITPVAGQFIAPVGIGAMNCPATWAHHIWFGYLKRRRRSELLTTVTEESAIAAAAKMGACSFKNGTSGERIASGIKTVL